MLLTFAEEMDRKPVNPDDFSPSQVHELSAPERVCPCCGVERKEIGKDESSQVEYLPGHFERIDHLRKKYACLGCESNGNNPQMETAASRRQ